MLTVVKLGGNVLDDATATARFLDEFCRIDHPALLVHGGGKIATDISRKLGIEAQMIDGRRITDAESLQVVTMVYAGLLNKRLVAGLQQRGRNAIGMCGVDANLIRARKRQHPSIDFGFVGDVESVNTGALVSLFGAGLTPVIAPITHDGAGQLLNTNADTIAAEIAAALVPTGKVRLVYCFEKNGVLRDKHDDSTAITALDAAMYQQLRAAGDIDKGMIPKLDNAFRAASRGVAEVIITRFDVFGSRSGTAIVM